MRILVGALLGGLLAYYLHPIIGYWAMIPVVLITFLIGAMD